MARAARAFTGHTVWYRVKEKGGEAERVSETRLFVSRNSICWDFFSLFYSFFLLFSDDIKLTPCAPYGKRESTEEKSVKQGHLKQQERERSTQRMALGLLLSGSKSA